MTTKVIFPNFPGNIQRQISRNILVEETKKWLTQ